MAGSTSLLRSFVRLNGSLKDLKPERDRYRQYASQAREFILRETERHCDEFLDRPIQPLLDGFSSLAERSSIRLISLNYDDLPLKSNIKFTTGFVDAKESFQIFRPSIPWPDDCHIWCQLHGSVLFRVKSMSELGEYEIVRYRNRVDAAAQEWIHDIYWPRYPDRHQSPLSPIITGLRKADAIQEEPYASYAHVFREEALSCDRWLIIGYSGGDRHINSVLSHARTHWRRSGRKHRVVIVTYWDFEDLLPPPNLGTLVFDPEFDEVSYRTLSLIGEESVEDIRDSMDTVLWPSNLWRVSDTFALTGDGVDWAMGPGLRDIMEFLGI